MMVRSTCWATRGSTPSSFGELGDAGQHLVLPARSTTAMWWARL